MSRSPTSVHTNSEMESEINRFSEIIAENNTISMLPVISFFQIYSTWYYNMPQQHSTIQYIM